MVPERLTELVSLADQRPLSPAEAAKMRAHVLGLLRARIPQAHRVVMGELAWSPTQARLFAVLLDKCVPNLSARFMADEAPRRDLAALSRDELEALAGGVGDCEA